MDTSSDRDFAVSFLHAASLAMVHLSRLAEDVIYFTAEEFGFFELADSSATGSSMMPQKKNPDPMELVRGKAGRAIGHHVALLVAMKGLPTGYNKDLQEDKEGVFDAEDTLTVSLEATASVVAKLTLRPDRTGKAASGLLLATDAADYLVRKRPAIPRRPRSGRPDGARTAGRRARLRRSVAGRVARVLGRCSATT